MKILENKRIILGVTGSIAAYKTVTLASSLTKAGALVDVILTAAASKLVSPITFSSVTGRKAFIDEDLWKVDDHVLHIEMGENNDALLIAPTTANTIAKLAHGMADNLLTLTALASRTVPLIAPAMDGGMYSHQATQDNLELLRNRGVEIWGPAAGHLASGQSGKGRMLEPDQLLGHLRGWLGKNGILQGKKIVVTAGGTQEPIDPVRVIGNRSSGKQGFAIAQASLDQGAEVTLITAPVSLISPIGVKIIQVKTADEMAASVFSESSDADLLIMAAAVADYKPSQQANSKIKKEQGGLETVKLERTVDILREIARAKENKEIGPKVVIGFAAETENLHENAKSKLVSKNLDMIVANDVSREDRGIGSDKNQVTLIWKDGQSRELTVMDKSDISDELVQEAAKLLL